MVEKDVVIKEKIRFSGIGEFKASYNHAHDWLKDEGFSITEDLYKEQVKGDSKDIEIKWTITKIITDYFLIRLNLIWIISGMTDVEVEINGKKKTMNKFADLTIVIKGTLEKDYNSKWEGSATHKFLKDAYHKFVIGGRTEEKEGEVEEVVQEFKD